MISENTPFEFYMEAQKEQRLIAWLMTQVDGFKAEAMLMRHFIALGDAMDACEAGIGPADDIEALTLLIDVLKAVAADYERAAGISEMWRTDTVPRNSALIMEHLNARTTARFDLICAEWCTAAGGNVHEHRADSWGHAPDDWLEAAIKGIRPGK